MLTHADRLCVCVSPAALMSGGGVLMRRLWAVVFRVREVVQVFVTLITNTLCIEPTAVFT